MKITQLMLSKGLGGAERYFIDLSLALGDANHDVQVVCHERFVERQRLNDHPRITLELTNSRGMWDLRSVRKMEHLIVAFGAELIHAHLARGAWTAGRIAARTDLPVVVKTHNYVKLKYYRHVDMFIPTTASQEAYLLEKGVAQNKIFRIANFSALPPAQEAVRRGNTPLTFVTYGRHVEKKGFKVLLRAFRVLLDSGLYATLVIGGDGPQRGELVDLARRLDLSTLVKFPGWIGDVASLLNRGEIFVLPSLDEPFGIVLLEAMACGRSIVTTRTQGPLEVLDDDTAFFADIGDPASLAKAMQAAAENAQASHRKAAAALDRYRMHYHQQAVLPKILHLYDVLTKRGRQRELGLAR